MTSAERTSRRARRFVLVGAGFLLLWQLAEIAGITRRTAVVVGVLGFVFHTVFGKAYSLLPAYFDRDLATNRFMPVHLGCSAAGTVLLAVDAERAVPAVGTVGSVLWAVGVGLFLGTLGWSIRDNLAGRETGTGSANADRRAVDRFSNAFVPVALAYLALGTYALVALHTPLAPAFDGYWPRISHLLTAGATGVLLFAVGFRLLPRFLTASPPWSVVAVVLPAGAVGPLLLAVGLPSGFLFRLGAVVEALAVGGFAVAFLVLLARSNRTRVGFYGVAAGVLGGVLAVLIGLSFAFGSPTSAAISAHVRLNVLGFLGLSIVGVTYQFYPPAVGSFRGASDRSAGAVIGLIAGGLLLEVGGLLGGVDVAVSVGRLGTAIGALLHVALLVGLFREQYG